LIQPVVTRVDEVRLAMRGVLLLAQLDRRGFDWFDRSLEGFWRSYAAAFIALPIYAALLLLRAPSALEMPSDWLVEAISYAVRWGAFALVMVPVADMLGQGRRYFDMMVPYNWAAVPEVGLLLVTTIVGLSETLPGPLVDGLEFVALFSVLVFKGFIIKAGLGISTATAATLILGDVTLSFLVDRIADGIKVG
jgi:hypothetical protein